ncbi:MAG: 1-deoxy-D-xylulose-5-phosphate reductoisomerase [Xanthomonadaceae bacterium]|nr:1-deoxy-D-xylulose-5-phosphate reductoisomerase [Xanthomonadaceae bacterium]
MKCLTILGATGTIGRNTLDVVARHPDRFTVHALTAHSDWERLAELCREHRPSVAVIGKGDAVAPLAARLREFGLTTEVRTGADSLAEVAAAPEVDAVMAAIVGAAGLLPTLAAARAGKRVLLANKEALVMSGALFMDAVHKHGAELVPIDSEHNAVFQCLPHPRPNGLAGAGIRRIVLTASGGPFRDAPVGTLDAVTPEQAVAHPNWVMGKKISVDSATMMNKGLEVIEACWLFDASPEQVEVVVHPQSIVHSMVEFADGSVLAQLGNPDMRTPIAHALAWPDRIDAGVARLDLTELARLDFRAPDHERFPCLQIAFDAQAAGGAAPAVLNAANEIAVGAFLARRIRFTDISRVIRTALDALASRSADGLDEILAVDRDARAAAEAAL